MQPAPLVVSDQDPFLRDLVAQVTSIHCADYFTSHIGTMQHEQRAVVSRFQSALLDHLRGAFQGVDWKQEHCPNPATRDSIDIFGKGSVGVIAIELDKNRADQVAKKFVSRMAVLPSTVPVYFLSICYPGTDRMSKAECVKYFGYCKTLALRMSSHYAGLIIQ